jgi:hypothetical protein
MSQLTANHPAAQVDALNRLGPAAALPSYLVLAVLFLVVLIERGAGAT